MAERRRICVVTGGRADYGLLKWLMHDIADANDLELQVVATGMHLSPEFGNTVSEIEADGFAIAARVEMLLSADTPVAIAKSIGLGCIGFADAFANLKPDLLVLLGDRFEVLAAAAAALPALIPIAHIHGGERTEGLIDESIRHAVTKMAHVHFVANEAFGRRIIAMGERPESVFVTGAPGLDALNRIALLGREELHEQLGFSLEQPTALLTFHPVTLESRDSLATLEAILRALDDIPDLRVIATYSNADTRGRVLSDALRDKAAAQPEKYLLSASLGQQRYLSLLKQCAVVIGNSSSGLIEAPSVVTPCVNVGVRQRGRIRAQSVIDCGESFEAISAALAKAMSPEFQAMAKTAPNPYGDGHAVARILDVIRTIRLDDLILKPFHDVTCASDS